MTRARVLSLIGAAGIGGAVCLAATMGAGAAQPGTRGYGVDRFVVVQIRHDLLGLRTEAGIGMDDAATADRASVVGKMVSVGPEFVVVEVQNEEVWVPRENVLLIQFRR